MRPEQLMGAYDANKIPDHVALSLMFRLIQRHRAEHQDQRLEGDLNLIGLDGKDRDALLSASDEFNNLEMQRRIRSSASCLGKRTCFIDNGVLSV